MKHIKAPVLPYGWYLVLVYGYGLWMTFNPGSHVLANKNPTDPCA
jgi:hypothetical protein